MSKPPRTPYPPDLPEPPDETVAPPPRAIDSLVDCIVTDADWANERVPKFSAQRVELRRCRLTGAELAEAVLRDVSFVECRLDLAGLRHARLERVVFRDCRMNDCDLYGATLEDVLFERCDLRESTISETSSRRLELRGCELTGLRGAERLRDARMPWNDMLANAVLFASVVGIDIVE